jgi:hypothetical protein
MNNMIRPPDGGTVEKSERHCIVLNLKSSIVHPRSPIEAWRAMDPIDLKIICETLAVNAAAYMFYFNKWMSFRVSLSPSWSSIDYTRDYKCIAIVGATDCPTDQYVFTQEDRPLVIHKENLIPTPQIVDILCSMLDSYRVPQNTVWRRRRIVLPD